jgi:hypothetical protein
MIADWREAAHRRQARAETAESRVAELERELENERLIKQEWQDMAQKNSQNALAFMKLHDASKREVESLRTALRELVESYDYAISSYPAEFVSADRAVGFEKVIDKARALSTAVPEEGKIR